VDSRADSSDSSLPTLATDRRPEETKLVYEYLTLLNDEVPCTSNDLSEQLVKSAKKVLDGLFFADNNLQRFFFEMIILAYRRNITGPKELTNFLQSTWKVWLN